MCVCHLVKEVCVCVSDVYTGEAGGGRGESSRGCLTEVTVCASSVYVPVCWVLEGGYHRQTILDLLGLLSFRDFHFEFDPCSVNSLSHVWDDPRTFLHPRLYRHSGDLECTGYLFIDTKLLTLLHCGHSAGLVRAVIPRVSYVRSFRWSRACGQSAGLVRAVNPLVSYM